jgi:hypothetical protein
MRSIYKIVALTAAGMLLVPSLATATDVEAELRQMQTRMDEMDDRQQATDDQLASANAKVQAQQEIIETSGLEEREERSALSSFLEKTDFSGWVAASYNYNFRGTDDAAMQAGNFNQGAGIGYASGGFYPHHTSPNTFQLDQVWFSIDKAPTEESRAGFHIDIEAGNSTYNRGLGTSAGFTGSLVPDIFTAYVSYLAPIHKGIQVDVGKMPTLLGGEVQAATGNFQITRGVVWGIQPVTSTGLVTSMEVLDGFTAALGILNSPISDNNWDFNSGKAVTSQIGYATDKFGATVGLNWGREGNSTTPTAANGSINDSTGILDVLLTVDPLDNLSAWINYDYKWEKNSSVLNPGTLAVVIPGLDTSTHAFSIAGRLGVLDTTGISLRFEYLQVDVENDNLSADKVYGLTGTVDHSLTDNLVVKAEVRWDQTDRASFFHKDGTTTPAFWQPAGANGAEKNQVVGVAQIIYEF